MDATLGTDWNVPNYAFHNYAMYCFVCLPAMVVCGCVSERKRRYYGICYCYEKVINGDRVSSVGVVDVGCVAIDARLNRCGQE